MQRLNLRLLTGLVGVAATVVLAAWISWPLKEAPPNLIARLSPAELVALDEFLASGQRGRQLAAVVPSEWKLPLGGSLPPGRLAASQIAGALSSGEALASLWAASEALSLRVSESVRPGATGETMPGTGPQAELQAPEERGEPKGDEAGLRAGLLLHTLHAQGLTLLMDGDFDAAVDWLVDASGTPGAGAQVFNDLAVAYLTRATVLDRQADVTVALDASARAIELDRTLAVAHVNRAIALERLGRADDANAEWNEVARLDPQEVWRLTAGQDVAANAR